MEIEKVLRQTIDDWPNVPAVTRMILASVPILILIACAFWLRVLWPSPQGKTRKGIKSGSKSEETPLKESSSLYHHSTNGNYSAAEDGHPIDAEGKDGGDIVAVHGNGQGNDVKHGHGCKILEAGDVAGAYVEDWKGTFDLTLLVVSTIWLWFNICLTLWIKPLLFISVEFWLLQVPKLVCMMVVSIMAGLLCRHYCPVDSSGYIVTSKRSWFKVNYTRKIQHFAAYLLPLLFTPSPSCDCKGTLEMSWSVWMTLLSFLFMIRPIRESVFISMLQFNAVDRPEDRPHTLEWIIMYNIWPGELLIMLFSHLFALSGQRDLVYILVFVTGIGDGLAEPVGIFLGQHKYTVRSCQPDTYYQRSLEGSCCVFVVGVITVVLMYASFATFWQFLAAFLTLPLALTLAEACSPHTMDTPFIMGVGGVLLFAMISLL